MYAAAGTLPSGKREGWELWFYCPAIAGMLAAEMKAADDESGWKQIAAAAGILGGLGVAACGTLLGWRHLPGLLGEWVGLIVGVMTTPFLLEASAVVIGLMVVLALNGWRRKRAGEEWVELKEPDEKTDPGK